MTVELIGTITQIFPIEQKKDYKFQRVRMEIDQSSQYPQTVEFQANDKTFSVVDMFGEGDIVKATCNVRGNVWQDKCFISFNLWKMENTGQQPQATNQAQQPFVPPTKGEADDLPF